MWGVWVGWEMDGIFKKASRHRGKAAEERQQRKGSREEKAKEKRKHPQITQITQIFYEDWGGKGLRV